ncbi:MAG: hypothetical protein ABIR33_06880 [Pyrinomonadaceae bacterium]
MKLSKAAAGVSFVGAFAIGIGIASFFVADAVAESPGVTVTYTLAAPRHAPALPSQEVPVYAEDLVGVWHGTWDHTQVPATLTISRIDGNKFYGVLTQREAEISVVGTIDESDRRVFFHETKVLKIGTYGEWSLGTNSGAFSADGGTLTGTGIDKWGTYQFDLTKE